MSKPIKPEEMAGHVASLLRIALGPEVHAASEGASVVFSAPATGQRFAFTIREVAAS